MNRRGIKQFIYGSFFICILLLLVFGSFFLFFRGPASCFDNRQNQNEAGIDCGGSCEPCALKTARPLEVQSIKILPADVTSVALLQIKNPNTALGAQKFSYEFTAIGDLGIVLKSIHGDSFIYPGEIKYIVLPDLGYRASKIKNTNLVLGNETQWVLAEQFKKPKFEIRKSETEFLEDGLSISGMVQNKEVDSFKNVIVNVILRDSDRNVLGATRTIFGNWEAFGEKEFTLTYPADTGLEKIDPSLTQVFMEAEK